MVRGTQSRVDSLQSLMRRCSLHYILLGQDATEAFEDVGHSDEARALLPAMLIGEFEKDSVSEPPTTPLGP